MRRHKATTSMDLVKILLHYAASQQIELEADDLRRDVLADPSARISIERLLVLWDEIVRCSDDENFGLHLGQATDSLSTGGILFSVMMNCATLESALEQSVRFHNLVTDLVQLHVCWELHHVQYVWDAVDAAIY